LSKLSLTPEMRHC
jgi:hypothetical protein